MIGRGIVSGAGALLTTAAAALLAQAPPATDIYLYSLNTRAVANVTNRPGYDNQPSFTPDGRAILYTSVRDDGQSDIYRYDLASKATTRVTNTPESEYSATVMPGGTRFSVIRVEKDSTQRLWSFALDGSDPRLVVAPLKPVGYHVWLDANRLAMFVLGNPNALVVGDLRTGKMDTVARNIGRSLATIPGSAEFSFVDVANRGNHLRAMNPATHATRDIVDLPRGVQDLVWLADGTLIVGQGTKLFAKKAGSSTFEELADLSSHGLTEITRLAVSPDQKMLAIVAIPR